MMDGQSSGGECQSQVGEVETVCSHEELMFAQRRNDLVGRSECGTIRAQVVDRNVHQLRWASPADSGLRAAPNSTPPIDPSQTPLSPPIGSDENDPPTM